MLNIGLILFLFIVHGIYNFDSAQEVEKKWIALSNLRGHNKHAALFLYDSFFFWIFLSFSIVFKGEKIKFELFSDYY